MPLIATAVYLVGILGLFWMDRRAGSRSSGALWLPVVWISIASSRSLSEWLQIGKAASDNSPLDRAVAALLMTWAAVVLFKRRSDTAALVRSNVPVLAFFLYCAFSVLWSEYPAATLTRWWKAVGDLLMIGLILSDPAPIEAVWRVLSRVGFILLPVSVLFNKYYPELGRYYDQWEGRQYFSGVTVDKNMLGVACLTVALASTWCLISGVGAQRHRRDNGSRLAHAMVVYTALWLFVRIDSVTSLSCFLLGVFLMLALRVRAIARAGWLRHVLLGSAAAFITAVLFFQFGRTILEMMGRDPTLTGRTELWPALAALSPNPLFGAGFEAFWRGPRIEQLAQVGIHANEAHNGYFEVYLNLGWTGVALLVILIATGYRNISQTIRLDSEAGALWLAYFVVGLIYSLTEAGFRMHSPMWITFLMAVMGASVTRRAAREAKERPRLRDPLEWGRRSTWNNAARTSSRAAPSGVGHAALGAHGWTRGAPRHGEAS